MLKRFAGHIGAKTAKFNYSISPMDPKFKLHEDRAINLKFKEAPGTTNTSYRVVNGSLLWLANGSRVYYRMLISQLDPSVLRGLETSTLT